MDYDLNELRQYHEREQQRDEVLRRIDQMKRRKYSDPEIIDDQTETDEQVWEVVGMSGAEWKELSDAAEVEGIRIPSLIRRLIEEGLRRRYDGG